MKTQTAHLKIVRGQYVAIEIDPVFGIRMTGRIKGDYATGFWAYTLDGEQLLPTFWTPDDAAEVLALEFAIAYGAATKVSA